MSFLWYHANSICESGYQLPLISITLIFENILSKEEQKITFAHYQTCYANSTEGTVHGSIRKNQLSPTIFLHDPKMVNIG